MLEHCCSVFFNLFAVKFTLAACFHDLLEIVGDGADNIGFANIGGRDMNGTFKDFQKISSVRLLLLVTEKAVAFDVQMIGLYRLKVILQHFAPPVLAGALAGIIAFQLAVAEVDSVHKEHQIRPEGINLRTLNVEFVGQLLHHRKDILIKEGIAMNHTVAGVEEIELHPLQRN